MRLSSSNPLCAAVDYQVLPPSDVQLLIEGCIAELSSAGWQLEVGFELALASAPTRVCG
jgi:hypothetical protein